MATSGLAAILVKQGLLTDKDKKTITDTCGHLPNAFAKGVIALGLMNEDELADYIVKNSRFKRASRNLEAETHISAKDVISNHLLRALEVVPLQLENNHLTIAVMDPLDKETLHQLEFFSGYKLRPMVAKASEIKDAIAKVIPNFAPTKAALESVIAAETDSPKVEEIPLVGAEPEVNEVVVNDLEVSDLNDVNETLLLAEEPTAESTKPAFDPFAIVGEFNKSLLQLSMAVDKNSALETASEGFFNAGFKVGALYFGVNGQLEPALLWLVNHGLEIERRKDQLDALKHPDLLAELSAFATEKISTCTKTENILPSVSLHLFACKVSSGNKTCVALFHCEPNLASDEGICGTMCEMLRGILPFV